MTPTGLRVPLRRSLLGRLLLVSILIVCCSVTATAWLAAQTTARAIHQERGQSLSDDTDILRELSGYAATHTDWDGGGGTVRGLADKTGRRIALTTAGGHRVADSSARRGPLLPRASATVDPLHTDTYTQRGAQIDAIDPRAVGPFRLERPERDKVRVLARIRRSCLRRYGVDAHIEQRPSGRSYLRLPEGNGMPLGAEVCADGALNTPVPSERRALDGLQEHVDSCLRRQHMDRDVSLLLKPDMTFQAKVAPDSELGRQATECVDTARRVQLDPYVAPVAQLYLGTVSSDAPRFDLSRSNTVRIVGVTALVLALAVAVTAAVATRLVRPLRALTAAAQQPPQEHVRVPVTTKDETGRLAAAFNDLTERRERLEDQRKAMVSDIAHELRTPLTNIRGWLEVARDGLVEPGPELLDSLHEEAVLLQHVIDDLQDLAAADAGTLRVHRAPVRVQELFDQVASAHQAHTEQAEVRLRSGVDGEVWLTADAVRMRQALGNLVSNAVRHTPRGGTVTLRGYADGGQAVIEVADTGEGIGAEDLPLVFDRFWRAEKSRSRRTGGSGLGLPIVRQLVTAHEGTVTVASTPGEGTVFTLRLPLHPPGSP